MYEEENNLEQQGSSFNSTKDMKPKKDFTKYIFIAVIALLLIGNVSAFYYIFKNFKEKKINENIQNVKEIISDENLNNNSNTTTTIDLNATTKQKVDLTEGEILVEWSDWPVKKNNWDVFPSDTFAKIEDFLKNEKNSDYSGLTTNQFMSSFDSYRVGKITQGNYTGSDLYIITMESFGMPGTNISRVIKNIKNGELIVLDKRFEQFYDPYSRIFILNNNITIANLEPQETINIPNSNLVLKKRDTEPYKMMTIYDNLRKIFQYDKQNYVYKDDSSTAIYKRNDCFVVKANDGTAREYYIELKFLGEKSNSGVRGSTIVPYKLDITWSNGTKNVNEYVFENLGGGCTNSNCFTYAYNMNIENLKEIGKTGTGDSIYALKDNNFENKLKDLYDQYYPGYNSTTGKTNEKIPFEQFVIEKPIIFWQDPFGDFVEFKNAKYLPGVECS